MNGRSEPRRPRLMSWQAAATVALFSATLGCATTVRAQGPTSTPAGDWTWAALRATPNVNTARVEWLEQHMTAAQGRELFAMIGRLTKPEVAQLLAERMFGDGSASTDRAFADSLYARPATGVAGSVDVAYFAARLRDAVLTRSRATGVFATEFSGAPIVVPKVSHAAAAPRAAKLQLRFDVSPAETLLAIISTPNISPDAARKRISTPAFDALISHRSQPFYPVPWSRELMAENLTRAASTDPIDRLYVWAQPRGLLQYGDVSANRDRYRVALAALRQNERAILDYVADTLAAFIPEGVTVNTAVSIYFAGGADGWGSAGATAFDLEYFKDDFPRLLNVIVHETYHAAQTAVALTSKSRSRLVTLTDSALAQAATTLLLEGTANYIAPAKKANSGDPLAQAREGERIVERVFDAAGKADRGGVQQALNVGVAGGGPFYWLGAAMSKAIVDAFGTKALAKTLQGSGADFVAEYLRAVQAVPSAPRFFSPEVAAAMLHLRS
jgi:putative zinc-dependent peptidase DUF5700